MPARTSSKLGDMLEEEGCDLVLSSSSILSLPFKTQSAMPRVAASGKHWVMMSRKRATTSELQENHQC